MTHTEKYFSLFETPKRIKAGDLILSSVSFILILFFIPQDYLQKIKLDLGAYAIFVAVSIIVGLASSYFDKKKQEINPEYIRSWWAFISGITAIPITFFSRKEALPFAITMVLIGLGQFIGHYIGAFKTTSNTP